MRQLGLQGPDRDLRAARGRRSDSRSVIEEAPNGADAKSSPRRRHAAVSGRRLAPCSKRRDIPGRTPTRIKGIGFSRWWLAVRTLRRTKRLAIKDYQPTI